MRNFLLVIFSIFFLTNLSQGQTKVCLTQSTTYLVPNTGGEYNNLCPIYKVRIFIHYMYGNSSPGYNSSSNTIILNGLNDVYNKYGIRFELKGSRTWLATRYTDEIFKDGRNREQILDLFKDSNANNDPNAINIYILDRNSIASAGKANGIPSNALFVGGNRNVLFNCQYISYELPLSRVVAHEVGHCLGLQETHSAVGSGDGDGLSDTPINYVDDATCVNPTTCQFVGKNSCNNCLITSNPMQNMINVMSYTTPKCMSYFSPMQLERMRKTLDGYLASTSAIKVTTSPNLQTIKHDGISTYTTNFISSGTHNLSTNIDIALLSQPLNWTSSNNSIYWTKSGSYNENVRFDLYSGQSTNFTVTANNGCGTSTRTITFYVQSAWRLASTQVASTLSVSFDDVSNSETLPQQIEIYDEATNKKEKVINVKQLHKDKAFKDKTLDVNISSITSGSKILVFHYLKSKNSKGEEQYETKTDKIVRIAPRSEIIEDDHTFRIYPTPVIGVLQLELFSKTKKNVVIDIFNSLGAAVKQVNLSLETGLNTNSIDVSDLTSGVYFLHSSDSEHILNVLRFVKEEE